MAADQLLRRLLKVVPKELRVVRRLPAPCDNAYEPWQAAIQALRLPRRKIGWDADFDLASNQEAPTTAQLSRFVRRNSAALAAIDEGMRRREFAAPLIDLSRGSDELPFKLTDLFALVRARLELAVRARRWSEAVDAAIGNLRMTQMVVRGSRVSIDYLFGVVMDSRALADIRRLACDWRLPVEPVQQLFGAVAEPPILVDAARAARGEFLHFWIPYHARVLAATTSEQCIEEIIRHWQAGKRALFDLQDESIAHYADDSQREEMAAYVAKALAGHPRPFDLQASVRRHAQWQSQTLSRLVCDPKRAPPEFVDEPETLWPSEVVDFFGEDIANRSDRKPSRETTRIVTLRRRLRKVAHPLSDLLVGASNAPGPAHVARQCDYRATRLVLLIRQHVDARGSLPRRLADLEDFEANGDLFADPFSEKQWRYSKRRKLLWSVGWDHRDSRGHAIRDRVYALPNWGQA